MRIEFDNDEERASAQQALEILENDNEFLSDAWNRDLYDALKAASEDRR